MNGELAPAIHRGGGDARIGRPGADERRVFGDSVGTEMGRESHGFHDIGFAVAVSAHEEGDSRLELQVEFFPGPEIPQRKLADVHGLTRQPHGHEQIREIGFHMGIDAVLIRIR